MECMTGVQKCLQVHGMSCAVRLGAYCWMVIAKRATLEYNFGVSKEIWGDLLHVSAVLGVLWGSSEGSCLGVAFGVWVGVWCPGFACRGHVIACIPLMNVGCLS